METDKAIFEKLIREDRAARESHHWRGTFLEYLDRVREDPSITKLAHARVYEMIMAPGRARHPRDRRRAREAALQGRAGPRLQLLRRGVLRHRAHRGADRALLPLRRAEGRGEPSGPLPDGAGRLGQELAGRAAAARPRGAAADLRHRGLPDAGGAAASAAAPPAARVREDARRAHRGRPLPGLPLSAQGRVRHPLRGGADRHALVLEAQPRRHRRRAAGRPEQPGHLGADRQRGHLQARPLLRGRPARARPQRRAQRRQPRPGRVHRGLQERDRVPARHDHRDAGEGDPGARPPRHGVRRHRHRRALERGGVAEVQGRPHQRGDPRPHRRGEGAVQPAPVGRGEDLPEDHPPLRLPRPRRAAHARGRLDVRRSSRASSRRRSAT